MKAERDEAARGDAGSYFFRNFAGVVRVETTMPDVLPGFHGGLANRFLPVGGTARDAADEVRRADGP